MCKSQPEHDEWMVSWTPHPGNPGQKVAISKAAVVAPVVGPAKRPVASPATSKVATPVVSVLSPPIKSPETKKMRVGHEPDEEPVTPEDDSCTSMASPESVGSTRKDLSPALEDAVDAPETPPTMRASPKALWLWYVFCYLRWKPNLNIYNIYISYGTRSRQTHKSKYGTVPFQSK